MGGLFSPSGERGKLEKLPFPSQDVHGRLGFAALRVSFLESLRQI